MDLVEIVSAMSDLLDKNFPKHQCKERGQALVLVAEIILILKGVDIATILET